MYKNKENEIIQRRKQYALKKSDPRWLLWFGASQRSKEKNIEFSITVEDIKIPQICPILFIEMDLSGEVKTGNRDLRPSLDRVDNSQGYTKDNVAVICTKANRMKQDNTIETLEAILKYMKDHKR